MEKATSVHIGQSIRKEIEGSGMTIRYFAEKKLHMTEVGLHKILNKEHINTELLFKISELLNKPVSVLLSEKQLPETKALKSKIEPEEKGNAKLNIDNNGIRVKIKIEIELDPDQITRADDIRQRIIKALK